MMARPHLLRFSSWPSSRSDPGSEPMFIHARWLGRALLAAAMTVAMQSAAADAPAREIRFVDDRGEPITSPLEVCLTTGLERACRTLARAHGPFAAEFEVITAEGPEHGSVSARRLELPTGEDGSWRLVVPRKGRLRVRRLPAEPVSLSLYKKDDPFRRPAFRLAAVGAGEVRVPAGEFVLSLAGRSFAPDLHLVSIEPGESRSVELRRRPGWSLVVRAVSHEARPLAGVTIEVTPTPGYGAPGTRQAAPPTDHSGITLLSGLTMPLATAVLRRPGWIERQEPGLSASAGTFAFREIPVERGGSVRATVTLEGQPAPGAACQLRASRKGAPRQSAEPPWVLIFEGKTGRDGVCRAEGIPQGSYGLWVRPAAAELPGGAALITAVHVESGRETAVDLDLAPVVVEGTVFQGDTPAPGWRIEVSAVASEATVSEEAAEVTTDDDGRYRAVLWAPGEYFFAVTSPAGAPALFEREDVSAAGTTRDFYLAPHEIAGAVVDGSGRPVGEAHVGVRWNSHRLWGVDADDAGRFAAPVEAGGGTAELTAHRKGYHSSETVRVDVPKDGAPPPVVLVLQRSDELAGVLVSAAGAPVAGAWVASYESTAEGMPWQLGATTTDAEGRFSVPRAKSGLARLVVTGPGCPLSAIEIRPAEGPLTAACAEAPANLEVTLRDVEGRPVPQEVVALRRGAVILPREAVATHLARLGLPAATDGHGRLVLPALAPGDYDLYLGSGSSPMSIAAGLPFGHLTTAALLPLTTTELEVTARPAGE